MSQPNLSFFRRLQPIQLPDEIRLGSKYDGGYVVPISMVKMTQSLISFGYGFDSNFERSFLQLASDSRCFLYESSIDFRSIMQNLFGSIVGKLTGKRSFPSFQVKCLVHFLQLKTTPRLSYIVKEVRAERLSENQISFFEVMNSHAVASGTFIKMDIEGGEYEILASASLDKVNAMVIEFHQIKSRQEEFSTLIEFLKNDFFISHLHVNNFASFSSGIPDVLEITFVGKHLIESGTKVNWKRYIPTSLDSPCDSRFTDEEIVF